MLTRRSCTRFLKATQADLEGTMKQADVVIVGAGASGMAAAYHIAKSLKSKKKIYILEHKESPGKKLLATGNGRCNFTNDVIDAESFRGEAPEFAYNIVKKYNKEWLIGFMADLGIIHTQINGYYYPRSLQASTVLNSFLFKFREFGVSIELGVHADNIKKEREQFIINTNRDTYSAKYVVLATGGKAYKTLGSDGSGYKLAKNLGHNTGKLYPSLTGIKMEGLSFKTCSGVRTKGNIKLYSGKELIKENYGEIQFTDYGISGIPVFQISRYAVKTSDKDKYIHIDFAPEYSEDTLYETLKEISEKNPEKPLSDIINAIIPYKLAKALCDKCKNESSGPDAVCRLIKNLRLKVKELMPFDKAQVTAGGVYTDTINNTTMESLICNGLYITGELLDIDGNCGGYNLHFAFASGACAGMDIGGKL